MAKPQLAYVTPKLLTWARNSAKYKLGDAAKKIGVEPDVLRAWESGDSYPTIGQATKLAALYKRPLALFYLNDTPKGHGVATTDFRRLPGTDLDWSPQLAWEHRSAVERRDIMLSLAGDQDEGTFVYLGTADLGNSTELLGERIRQQLGITWDEQSNWKDQNTALSSWRSAMEALNVLVFGTRNEGESLAATEARAFSIAATRYPVVVVNTSDVLSGKIFSLLHEYTHLLLNQGGICDWSAIGSDKSSEHSVEVFCNAAAAAALVPSERFRTEVKTRSSSSKQSVDNLLVDDLSRLFKVSKEVIVRRLASLDFISKQDYQHWREANESAWFDGNKKRRGGRVDYHVRLLGWNGKPYTKQVLEAYYSGSITLSEVAGYLDTRVSHISKLEQAAFTPVGA